MSQSILSRSFPLWLVLLTALPARASAAPTAANYEDSAEFFQPFADRDAPVVTAEGIDPSLKGKGTWAYQFTYVASDGTATDLAQYRIRDKIKPASVLKLFTGWMAYQKQAMPVDYLHYMLRRSDNARADKTLAVLGGPARLQAFYRSQNLPISAANFKMVDGSGLSHSNQVTSDLVTQLLTQIYVSGSYDAFKALLAEPGQDGTLSARLQDVAYPIHAKTGTLRDTAALAGYVDLNHGTLIFAVLSNQLKVSVASARGLIDRLLKKQIARAEAL